MAANTQITILTSGVGLLEVTKSISINGHTDEVGSQMIVDHSGIQNPSDCACYAVYS